MTIVSDFSRRQNIALAAAFSFCLISTAIVLYFYWVGYIPPVRTGASEIVDFYVQSWNLVSTPSWQNFFLTDQGLNDPHSIQYSNVYTHGPNAHRLIGGVLIMLGLANIHAVLIGGSLLGVLAIAAAFLVFMKRVNVSALGCALLLFILIDYSTFDQILNPYRTWHYSLFFLALAAVSDRPEKHGRRYLPGVAGFLLFQFEFVFALYLFVASVTFVLTGSEGRQHKRQILTSFCVGTAASILLFLIQVVGFYGSFQRVFQDAVGTLQERNTVLYAGRAIVDTNQIPTSRLVDMFSIGESVQKFFAPSGYFEYLRYAAAAVFAFYRFPVLVLGGCLAIAAAAAAGWKTDAVGQSSRRIANPFPSQLFLHPILRMSMGCLLGIAAIGVFAPGYAAYIYFMVRLPMLNLTAFLVILSLCIAIQGCAKKFSHDRAPARDTAMRRRSGRTGVQLEYAATGAAVIVSALILLNTNSGWLTYGSMRSANYGDEEFYALQKYVTRGSTVATNAAWPISGVVHGIIGRRSIQIDSVKDLPRMTAGMPEFYFCHRSKRLTRN